MKIFIGYDHRGVEKAYKIMEFLLEIGYEVNTPFDNSSNDDDYPDISKVVCEKVRKTKGSKGILLCGTGIGMCMSANKEENIRAVLAQSEADAYFSRKHEDSNVLVLPAGYGDEKYKITQSLKLSTKIVETFLKTDFEAGRHLRRVKKLNEINKNV